MKEKQILKAWHLDEHCVVTEFCPYCGIPHMHWADGSLSDGYTGLHVADCRPEIKYEITVQPGRPPRDIRRTLSRLNRLAIEQRDLKKKLEKTGIEASRQARWETYKREELEEMEQKRHEKDGGPEQPL